LSFYHFAWAFASAIFFRFPSRKIKVIGVTGTNGKTTTIDMIAAVLEQAGYKVAAFSSIYFKTGNRKEENKLRMTMPGRGKAQSFLREAVNAGCDYAIIEVTSEGIAQHRQEFIRFETAVFTNLSPEHIESHGSFEKYKQAKGKLFKKTKGTHILNADDGEFGYFNGFKAKKKYIYGIDIRNGATGRVVRAENVEVSGSGAKFKVDNVNFEISLLGRFNVYNALAGICVGLSQGIDLNVISQGLRKVQGVPGRMEMVIKEPFRVIVDYAFTPNALEKVYKFLNLQIKAQGSQMICVLGSCGGNRDKWKRPILGELASQYCDEVIVTNEDPYDEDPMEIINQVAQKAGSKTRKILDRREAIKVALGLAKKGDVVVITGKGAEPSICLAQGKQMPWDDREIVRTEVQNLRFINHRS